MTHANLLLLEYLCFILFGWIQVKLLNLKFQKLFIFGFLKVKFSWILDSLEALNSTKAILYATLNHSTPNESEGIRKTTLFM